MKRLNFMKEILAVAESRTGQFVQISAVGFLLLWQHPPFAGADAGTGQLSAFGQRDLGFFREGAEARVLPATVRGSRLSAHYDVR
jgi:hypothetical protein